MSTTTNKPGTVMITFEGKEIALVPTFKNARILSQSFTGLMPLTVRLQNQDIDACAAVIRWGANNGMGLSDAEAKNFPQRVWKNKLTGELLGQLMTFVAILGNGGEPLPEVATNIGVLDGDGDDAEGNE